MDSLTVATLAVALVVLYRIIDIAVKLLKIVLLSEFPPTAEELPNLPFIGHVYLFIGSNESTSKNLIKLGKMYPALFRLCVGRYSMFFTTHSEDLKEILLSPKTIEKHYVYNFARPCVGDGLVTAPASIWEVHRKLLQPSFNSVALKSFVKTFATQSVILAKKMEQHLDGSEFEIHRYVSLCTLDAICVTAMGVNLKAQESEECRYDEAIQNVFASFATRTFSPWLYPDFVFYRTQLGKDQRKHIKFIHEFADNVIRQKKTEIVRPGDKRLSTDEEQGAADDSTAGPQILIENLFRLSNENQTLTDKEVRDHVDTMIAAGSDTTAITMNYVLLMLASHQDIQEKVYQELCDIFGEHVLNDDSEELHITMEVLARMTYMERVIKETMRLFPVVPLMSRTATDDFDLGHRTFPRGTSIVLNIFGVHRSEKYWPDPLKFDPDRFLPERFARQQPYSYLPFSGGRRNCIGWKYAMMLIKTITATVLRRYVLTKDKVMPVEDLRLTFDTLLKSVDPVTIRIQQRVK
ncbi:cytochrome P450 4C1-like isoform X1 [Neodiprion pinetum]|uniref:cytochrome P450 4C1-like isoform X1 n=1 Tax=Neodiprion pinetum TaxID=441929 RepID=UPI001EDE4422|nr:cytochrome P450 4C1-like isoform X1 [Neodiprion pinetum]XP_046481803.1 cytochrome P450 4C1-like isoform X1 [Neodiprion pinetum]